MSALRETPFAEYWPDAYRFAFLMSGSAAGAQAVIEATVPGAADRLTQMRDGRQAKRWLFAKLREQCRLTLGPALDAAAPPPQAPAEASPFDGPPAECARLFSHLPEEERCALALFYLHCFELDELAETMEMSPLDLGHLLSAARMLLGRHRLAPAG